MTMSLLAHVSKNDPYRHTGVPSAECTCGLVHDDELKGPSDIRKQAIELLGGRCVGLKYNPCKWINADQSVGCTDVRMLQIDHVLDNGAIERSHLGNGYKYYTHIRDRILAKSTEYQVLCANCNMLKSSVSQTDLAKYARRKRSSKALGDLSRH